LVRITDEARDVLNSIRTDALDHVEGLPEGTPEPGLRLLIEEEQATLALDVPSDEDQVVEQDGHPVLLIDPNVGTTLEGLTIDIARSAEGDRLIIEKRD
jgi:Fe-S cluster assembly iron-binding protein IscA